MLGFEVALPSGVVCVFDMVVDCNWKMRQVMIRGKRGTVALRFLLGFVVGNKWCVKSGIVKYRVVVVGLFLPSQG